MDIKLVAATRPPAPLHKLEQRQDTARQQAKQPRAAKVRPQTSHEADCGPHVDAYA